MIKIYYLGNEFIKSDSLAIKIVEEIKEELADKFEFVKMDTFEKIMSVKEGQIFLDVADGVKEAVLIEDMDDLEKVKTSTAHDMDFSFFLKLNNELENIKKVRIICIPQSEYKGITEDVKKILNEIAG